MRAARELLISYEYFNVFHTSFNCKVIQMKAENRAAGLPANLPTARIKTK